MNNAEIEVRFLEVDKNALIANLKELGAQDSGRQLLKEVIFADATGSWAAKHCRVRVRQAGKIVTLTYKESTNIAMHTIEHEVVTSDFDETVTILRLSGLVIQRRQEKYRQSFNLEGTFIEIDEWPGIPAYVEIEGPSIENLQETAEKLGFDWLKRTEEEPYHVIKNTYNIDLHEIKEFTFEKFGERG